MGFARQTILTFLVRVVLIPAGLLTAVVTARWLGPAQLGVFAAIGALVGTAAQFGNLGLPTAVTRFAAADPSLCPGLIANARLTGALTGGLAIVVLFLAQGIVPAAFGEVPRGLLLVAALALPFSFTSAQFQALLLGRRRIRHYNYMEAGSRIVLLAGTVVVLVGLGRGVGALVWTTAAIAAMQYLVYHAVLWPDSRTFRPEVSVLRRMGALSLRAYVTCLLSYLVLRSDLLLINGLLGARPTGVYSIAAQGADFLLLLPGVAGAILFPKIATGGDDADPKFTASVCRHAVLAMTAACLATAFLSVPAVHWLFGGAYGGAVLPLLILLPGVWCMAVQGILSNDLGGRDYPVFLPLTWSLVLAVNVGLNLLWLPRWGIMGAAASSTVAYVLSFALVTRYWLRRFPGVEAASLFLVDGGEIRALSGRVWRAVLNSPPAEPTPR